jgi:hypothetical protein
MYILILLSTLGGGDLSPPNIIGSSPVYNWKGFENVRDNCNHFSCALAAWLGYLIYHGWVDSYSFGYRNRSDSGACHSGSPCRVAMTEVYSDIAVSGDSLTTRSVDYLGFSLLACHALNAILIGGVLFVFQGKRSWRRQGECVSGAHDYAGH